ncbi:MAG TPA: flagellar assembly protein FliW, partial [Firmicutes bacterium]|nr:flagellar assembly protein FliW [Bacillota bacterium]
MRCRTTRFGEIEVAPESIITFPQGVPGFTHLKEFFLVPVAENPVFTWLQAVAAPEVAFLVTDPFLFFRDYVVNVPAAEKELLAAERPEDVSIQVILRVPTGGGAADITANLLAPVVINHRLRRAAQVVLDGSGYPLRAPLFAAPEKAA